MWSRSSRYTVMVEAFTTDLYRYALWLCGDRSLAEDLVQETFTRAWKALDQLHDEQAAKAWLLTTLRREHARTFERRTPEQARSDFDVTAIADPHRALDTSTEAFSVRRALARLSVEYREPLLLQVIEGYDCEEIAQLLELSATAVRTRLFRARQQLREALGDPRADAGLTERQP
ncbi:MAG: sigma-70 family RNA polymerase sigma factor [Gammaproteobacteria bacterium]|nr:sigma-70 family RNA polymerase sigma factor [Gammaproteobacteria bacterium]